MEIYKVLTQIMKEKNLKIADIARMCDLPDSTVRGIETRKQSKVALDVAFKLSNGLGVSLEYLNGMPEKKVDNQAHNNIEKYGSLLNKYDFVFKHSPDGAKIIDSVLDREYSIAKQISEQKKQLSDQQDQIDMLKQRIVTEIVHRFCLPFYAGLASAGSGEYLFDDIPTDMIEVEDTPTARMADFVIGVNGDSMDPDFCNGEKVFVKKTANLNIGDIGIFLKGNDCYIKELGKDRLISRNKDYEDIWPDEEIKTVGKVIGKVER